MILLSIPVFVGLYPKFPGGTLTALRAVFAVRPLADAACVAPLARLRGDLRFVTIAAVDAGIEFAATLLTIALAAWGAGALALVMPRAAGSVAKTVLYLWFTRGSVDEDAQDGGAGPGCRTCAPQ